jgi:hypothetical protein
LPEVRFAFEKLTVVTSGAPLVLRLTSVTGKLTAIGTEMLTVSCAPTETAAAATAIMLSAATWTARDRADREPLTVVSRA